MTIPGVVNASNASAGTVGEFVTATQSTNVAMTTAVAINVTSISLTAGDWDVDGNAFILASQSPPTSSPRSEPHRARLPGPTAQGVFNW